MPMIPRGRNPALQQGAKRHTSVFTQPPLRAAKWAFQPLTRITPSLP